MTKTDQKELVRALLSEFGQTYAEEAGVRVERNSPAELFRWLVAATLLSARIRSDIAIRAARALFDQGWTRPRKMADSTWAERTKVLNRAGYARYDERTSRMLGEAVGLLVDRYGGDLRRLREEAGRDPARERALLKELKGMGDVGVDIFFREVQVAWPEIAPFADRRATKAASRLGLPSDPGELSRLASGRRFPGLLAALTRVELDNAYERVRDRARARGRAA